MFNSSWFKTTKRRWSSNDQHFGPFTFSSRDDSSTRMIGVILDSGEDGDKCHVRFYLYKWTLIMEAPGVLKPGREWNDTSMYAWSKPEGGYWKEIGKEYGFQYGEGFLQIFHGIQTDSSKTRKMWCKHLPWTQWRHVRYSLYDLDGNLFWEKRQRNDIRGMTAFTDQYKASKACPAASFIIRDYDGADVIATTRIDEREWRFGEGWFKWLSMFRKSKIRRRLDISFSAEVGTEKGSWKGGVMGTAIDMLPGEMHEGAMRRYCAQEHQDKHGKYRVQFIGSAAGVQP